MYIAYRIERIIVRFGGVLVVLHAIDNCFVKAKAEKLLVRDQRLQQQPQTPFKRFQLRHLLDVGEIRIVCEHTDGKHQHVVG